jgi:uncharacterized protein (DUF302 family)
VKPRPALLAVLFALFCGRALAVEGLIEVKSPHAPKETVDRLESFLKGKGMTIFARVDHAAGAAKVGKQLRATELLIFGNPQGGTPLMECAQTIGIDLPLKALVWQDASGQIWVGYSDPVYLARRHGVPQCAAAEKMKATVSALIAAALEP